MRVSCERSEFACASAGLKCLRPRQNAFLMHCVWSLGLSVSELFVSAFGAHLHSVAVGGQSCAFACNPKFVQSQLRPTVPCHCEYLKTTCLAPLDAH
jgi:hypothetical protein